MELQESLRYGGHDMEVGVAVLEALATSEVGLRYRGRSIKSCSIMEVIPFRGPSGDRKSGIPAAETEDAYIKCRSHPRPLWRLD